MQNSVVTRINDKLSAKYYGPYPIVEKIGAVAYKLKLPAGSRVHPVFHVSLLKKAVGNYQEDEDLPDLMEEQIEVYYPDTVLATRKFKHNGEENKQLLIHWKGKNVEEATWEDEIMIRSQFLKFNLEDKINVEGGSIDRTQSNEEGPLNPVIHQGTGGSRPLLVYSRRKGIRVIDD
ncbi:RNA-directed DNA polymerase (Reverse transcriptase) [Trifolium medium]|uniref:RNA-directed DNA polymerase (Reverse transcriptase) n=1 Tax=Trifolium medium TaxID=97028 RepID=A0A392M214_9FABA|nr:RNA-directed DNA polymerase (Reverse transcriptase) [Trifolium medium]